MKRAILRLPVGTTFETLTEEQQIAIRSVFAQFVLPMPGTVTAEGWQLVDGLAGDNFDPSVMPGLGMDWPVVGLWQWGGAGDPDTLTQLDEPTFLAHLPPVIEYDEQGNVVNETLQTEPVIPHNWAGWPTL